ncbi:MAG TPA: PEP-CTERM sorting domain-containing protein [Verrucomicrobiae bacterium]
MKCLQNFRSCKVAFSILTTFCLSACLAKADFFVSDSYNDVVDNYDSSGSLVSVSSITGPTGLAIGSDGNLYVATPYDDGSSIETFNPNTGSPIGTFTSHVSDNDLNNPGGITFDSSGNLYVADFQSKILVYNNSGGAHINELTDINLNDPSSLSFDSSGTLYVADGANILSYSGGNFSIVNTPATFSDPHDVGVGLDGNLYVLDISGSTGGIYQLNPTTGLSLEIVNYSTSSFFANDLVAGPDGKLYVSGVGDSGDGEILQYDENGSYDGVYLDLGSGSQPTYMAFSPVPEPSALALMSIAGIIATVFGIRRKKSAASSGSISCAPVSIASACVASTTPR